MADSIVKPIRRRIAMVTGSREWADEQKIYRDLTEFDPHVVIHGGAFGADAIAHKWCREHGRVAHVHFPNYVRDGTKAPLHRNNAMARELRRMVEAYNGVGRAFAYPTETSRGTWHAVRALEREGFEVQTPTVVDEKKEEER